MKWKCHNLAVTRNDAALCVCVCVLHVQKSEPGEKWGKGSRKDAIEQRRLEGRVYRLECLVHDLCCAIVYCDDMALMEREILQIGDIHMDLSSNMTRPPLLLRRAVADLAWKHGRPVSPPEHKWQ